MRKKKLKGQNVIPNLYPQKGQNPTHSLLLLPSLKPIPAAGVSSSLGCLHRCRSQVASLVFSSFKSSISLAQIKQLGYKLGDWVRFN